jgi:hypothetical protein
MKPVIDQSFEELKSKGASCPADLTYDVLMVELRHTFLTSAKDMVASKNEGERVFGDMLSVCAEHLQSAIDVLGSDGNVKDIYDPLR